MVTLHFYGELNDYLSEAQRDSDIEHEFQKPRSVKDLIESIGVPHPEIDIIMVDGVSVDFRYQVQDGDSIAVYPGHHSPDMRPDMQPDIQPSIQPDMQTIRHLLPKAIEPPAFVLDVHLGKLAAYMRMLGFDCLYRNDYDDPELARISSTQVRTLLTCDRKLLHRNEVTHGYFVRSRDPQVQISEVIRHFGLNQRIRPFSRCINCNGLIAPVDKAVIADRLQPKTRQHYDVFYICQDCEQIYWQGSHVPEMIRLIDEIV